MSLHLLPGVRGLFLNNNKINGHKTDNHMQTTEGPKELTKKSQKTNKRICQGDCSQPVEFILPVNGGTLAVSQVNYDEILLPVLKIMDQTCVGSYRRERRGCPGPWENDSELDQFTGCRGPRRSSRPQQCAGQCAPAEPPGRQIARRTTRT